MELEYGCNLNKLLFSTLNLNDITCLTNDIKKVIEKWEKRISITDVRINTATENDLPHDRVHRGRLQAHAGTPRGRELPQSAGQ